VSETHDPCLEAVREATLLRAHVVTALSFFESVPLDEPFDSNVSNRMGERLVEHVRNIMKKDA